jgi:hypothetical protein
MPSSSDGCPIDDTHHPYADRSLCPHTMGLAQERCDDAKHTASPPHSQDDCSNHDVATKSITLRDKVSPKGIGVFRAGAVYLREYQASFGSDAKAYRGFSTMTRFCESVEVMGASLPSDLACLRTVPCDGILGNLWRPLSSLRDRARSSCLGYHELSWSEGNVCAGPSEANIKNHPRHGSV